MIGRARCWELPDWLAAVFLVAGISAVLGGLLPRAEAGEIVLRVLPLLIFLGSVFVLAELTAKAEVFDVLASRLARMARGNYPVLFGLCVVFVSATTIFLNLDTTAVLLTPVMLAIAAKATIPGMPLAMLTVWLANTASLLLPVSNLTNMLAYDRMNLTPIEFAIRIAAPQAPQSARLRPASGCSTGGGVVAVVSATPHRHCMCRRIAPFSVSPPRLARRLSCWCWPASHW